jgi:hypothetical protein
VERPATGLSWEGARPSYGQMRMVTLTTAIHKHPDPTERGRMRSHVAGDVGGQPLARIPAALGLTVSDPDVAPGRPDGRPSSGMRGLSLTVQVESG